MLMFGDIAGTWPVIEKLILFYSIGMLDIEYSSDIVYCRLFVEVYYCV